MILINKGRPRLVEMRANYLWFSVGLLLILAILPALSIEGDRNWPLGPTLIGLAVVGIGLLVEARLILRLRPLARFGPAAAYAFVTNFYLGVAFSIAPALLGFVLVFFTGSMVTYWVGLAISTLGLARSVPSESLIRENQQQLDDAGVEVDLLAGLMQPTPN